MTAPTYDDGGVVLDDAGLTIRHYYFPFVSKRIAYQQLDEARRRPLTWLNGRLRIWGTAHPRAWMNIDLGRPRKREAFVLETDTFARAWITPRDPDAFSSALAAHGVRVLGDAR